MGKYLLSVYACLVAMGTAFSALAEQVTGPVSAEVVRVVDGDTLLVNARPWPQQIVEVYVRLRGIDAPEIRSSCETTRSAGKRAQDALESLTSGRVVHLSNIDGDKYFGRVLADVLMEDGTNVSTYLVTQGLALGYDGGKRKVSVCPSQASYDPTRPFDFDDSQ